MASARAVDGSLPPAASREAITKTSSDPQKEQPKQHPSGQERAYLETMGLVPTALSVLQRFQRPRVHWKKVRTAHNLSSSLNKWQRDNRETQGKGASDRLAIRKRTVVDSLRSSVHASRSQASTATMAFESMGPGTAKSTRHIYLEGIKLASPPPKAASTEAQTLRSQQCEARGELLACLRSLCPEVVPRSAVCLCSLSDNTYDVQHAVVEYATHEEALSALGACQTRNLPLEPHMPTNLTSWQYCGLAWKPEPSKMRGSRPKSVALSSPHKEHCAPAPARQELKDQRRHASRSMHYVVQSSARGPLSSRWEWQI